MSKKHSERFVTLVDDALTRVEEITPQEVQQKLDDEEDDFVLLDVREKDEWKSSHIAGAQYLGKGIIERDIENEIPDVDQELVLYCGGGYRSALAADNLQKMGYKDVKSLQGGFRSWNEAGFPIVKKD
ncbi:MAG: rhodanese-like domain-containing protein [Balneolaceae bacterium]|nr:rhodanese-like domain-containing protein [Balneolaceae bacterium]